MKDYVVACAAGLADNTPLVGTSFSSQSDFQIITHQLS